MDESPFAVTYRADVGGPRDTRYESLPSRLAVEASDDVERRAGGASASWTPPRSRVAAESASVPRTSAGDRLASPRGVAYERGGGATAAALPEPVSLVDQQLNIGGDGASGFADPREAYFGLPREGAVRYGRDLSTQGSYWRVSRDDGEELPQERRHQSKTLARP